MKNCAQAECAADTGTKAYEYQPGGLPERNGEWILSLALRKYHEHIQETAKNRRIYERLNPLFRCPEPSAPFEAS